MSLLLLFSGGGAPEGTIVLDTLGDVSTINAPDVTGLARTVLLPTIGDASTINAPTITTPYLLALPTLGDVSTINAPNVFLFLGIALPTIGGGPAIGGLWIEIPAEEPPAPTPGEPIAASETLPDPRIRVRVVDPETLAEIAELDEAKRRQWQTVVGDAGTGLAVLENDDPDLLAATYGRLLRFELDGRAVFLASIERKRQVLLAQGEEAEEETEVGGRGILALFEDFVVYPEAGPTGRPFSDQRLLNWTSADFDDDGWQKVSTAGPIGQYQTGDSGVAKGFPDGQAEAVWAQPYQAGAGNVPVGYAYLRAPDDFEVATAGWYRVFLTADDGAIVTIDGVQAFAEARLWFHLEAHHFDVYLSAGPHQIAIRGENLDNGTGPATNSGWAVLSVIEIDEDGDLGDVILRTDTSWVAVGYPPRPPGMTPGRAIRILLEEAQARGGMVGWTLAFSDLADSNGQPWEFSPEFAFQCGLDGFSVLRQIAETYCEIDVAPAQKVLYAYAAGYGETTSIEYEEGVSILALSHEGSA